MPDFENNEIKDSAFPVDFNDETEALDMYGVWVKSGPRDISAYEDQSDSRSEEPVLPVFDTVPDITEFDDLPDFDINLDEFDSESTDTPTAEADLAEISSLETEEETIDMLADGEEESIEDFADGPDVAEAVDAADGADAEEELSLDSFADISTDDDTLSGDLPDFDISLDEFDGEHAETPTAEANLAEISSLETEEEHFDVLADGEDASEEETFDMLADGEDASEEEAIEDFADGADVSEAEDVADGADAGEEFSLDSFADSSTDDDTLSGDLPDFDISLDEFDDERADQVSEEEIFEDELDIARDESVSVPEVSQQSSPEDTATEEVDFSAFLADLEASTPPSPANSSSAELDDLDLDSFINEINESGGSSDKDKEKLFDDAEPVDIDLDFDEEFIENSEKIRAAGSLITESEYENSEFGVEFVDETDSDSDSRDAESFDSSILEESDESVSPVTADESDLEDATEFDDLLASLDDSKPTVDRSEKEPMQAAADYNLMVTEEDGLESIVTASPGTADDEDDVTVPLFGEGSDTGDTLPEDSVPDTAVEDLVEAEEPEEIPAFSPDSISSIDFGDDVVFEDMEIVEKDNLEITGESDYNEAQSGADSTESVQDVSIDFDDVGAFEESLHESGTDTGEYDVTSNDKSTELLMLIAEELSSIKKELSSLNTELSTVKKAPQIHDDSTPGQDESDSANTGFFSDDDTDEAIALTGDELNNILITADFTEEKNDDSDKDNEFDSDAGIDIPDDSTVADLTEDFSIDIPLDDESDVSGIGDSESDLMDVTTDFTPPEETLADEPLFDDQQNTIVAEEHDIPDVLTDDVFGTVDDQPIEVTHVNKIEDDISYLDGEETIEPDLDDVAIEEPDIETLDFNDDNLEEPELTEFNIDFSAMEQDAGNDGAETPEVSVAGTEVPEVVAPAPDVDTGIAALPVELKDEIKSVLSYMDQLLESLPEEKIEEFARSEHFDVYKKLFEELGIS